MRNHVYLRYLAAWGPMYLLPLAMLSGGVVERSLAVNPAAFAYAGCCTCH